MNENNHKTISKCDNAFFKSLFENNTMPMMLIRPITGEIVIVNNAALLFYGWSFEEITSMTVFEINTLQQNEVKAAMQLAFENNTNWFSFKHRLANGIIKDVEVYSGSVEFNGENLLYSTIIDQTEKELAQSETEKVLQFYRAITENAKEGVVVITADNKFTYISANSKKTFGYATNDDSVYSLLPSLCTHPDDREKVEAEIMKTFTDATYSPTVIYRFLTKSNDWIWIESTFTNMFNNPYVNGLVINFKEISNRIFLENQIRANEEFSKFLLQSSALFIDMPIENYELQINQILQQLCNYAAADRAYIFEYDNDLNVANNTFEYVVRGIEPKIKTKQVIPFENFELLYKAHKNGHAFVCNDTFTIPNGPTKDIVTVMKVKSIVAVPMMFNNTCVGCVGFDWVNEHVQINEKLVTLLGYFAQQIVSLNNRVLLEKKNNLNKERYRLTQKAGNIGGWEFDVKTGEYWQTLQFLRMFGIDIESKNKSNEIRDCVVDNDLLIQRRNELIEDGRPYNVIFEIVRKADNERRIMQSIAELFYGNDGKPERLLGVVIDITDEQNKMRQLKETEAEIKAVFNHQNYSVWSINSKYEITYINDKFAAEFEHVIGVRLSKGVNIYKALPAGLNEVWLKRYDRVLNNEAFVFEEMVPLGDDYLVVEVSASPIEIEGVIVGASFFGLDITQRKRQEKSLLESKAQLQQLLELSSTFIKISEEKIDYKQIADSVKMIAGAAYAVYNSYEDNATKCTTRAVCNKSNWISLVEQFSGTKVLNSSWIVEPYLREKLKNKSINRFDILQDLTENTIYKLALGQIQKHVDVGAITSLSIYNNQELVGNIYLFFDKNKDIQNIELCELFANHIGEYLGRKLSETKLKTKIDELERFQRLTVGRELTMIDLKKEVNDLLEAMGRDKKYKIVGVN